MSGRWSPRSSSSSATLPVTESPPCSPKLNVSAPSPRRSRTVVLGFLAIVIFGGLITGISYITTSSSLNEMPLPVKLSEWRAKLLPSPPMQAEPDISMAKPEVVDAHPIRTLMAQADALFEDYYNARPLTFKACIADYRARYGRHPPPGFDKWYLFARERGAVHLADFDQITDDLRPFWSIAPKDLRRLVKGMMAEENTGLAGITVTRGGVTGTGDHWRTVELVRMVKNVVKGMKKVGMHNGLPDMTIAMNLQDQPRVVVPWEDVQAALKVEEKMRTLVGNVSNSFSNPPESEDKDEEGLPTGEWFKYPGKQYMDLINGTCPPDSYARNVGHMDPSYADNMFKLEGAGGIVKNFNLSRDLCTVGPGIHDLHGLLFSSSTLTETYKLIPVFGECKVNTNNDILFPANMYYKSDPRYDYSSKNDVPWESKAAKMFWRGITSGGTQIRETWRKLHRHRLVLLTNSTEIAVQNTQVPLLTKLSSSSNDSSNPNHSPVYLESKTPFSPKSFASRHTDVGFHDIAWCVPDTTCGWLRTQISPVPSTSLSAQFLNKYLVDVDGHSFSGRWNAFLRSRSMGIKATIFREWHDSRLFAWHHFAPLDNRFDDLYTLLTYFIGVQDHSQGMMVDAHDGEAAKMAMASSKWTEKTLRREDMEVYVARLLLEYGRLLDDNRDSIGYGDDGDEIEEKPEWKLVG